MFNTFLEGVTDGHGALSPLFMSASLRMPISQLARVVNATACPSIPAPLRSRRNWAKSRVIATASDLFAGDVGKAVVWFRFQPLAGFAGQTAEELVTAAHTDAVLAHLETLRDDGYA